MTERLTRRQFEGLVAAARPVILGRLTRRFKDGFLADDVATDSLTAAWRKWEEDAEFFSDHDLTGWAAQRAGSRALDDLRRRTKSAALAEEHQGDEGEEAAKAPDAPAVAPPADPEFEQLRMLVHDAVSSLSSDDRFLLEGMSYERLTDQAMGAILYGEGDSTAQARGLRVFRRRQKALGRLRDRLLEWGFDEEAWRAGLAI